MLRLSRSRNPIHRLPAIDLSGEEPDERALMGVTAGLLWILAASVSLLGLLLPGSPRQHAGWVVGLSLLTLVYGIACLTDRMPWSRVSLRAHAVGTAITAPIAAVVFWATGGAHSYCLPLVAMPVLYSSFFFPPRMAVPLVAVWIATPASALVYDQRSLDVAFPATVLSLVAGGAALAAVLQALKRRLLEAERRQRTIAEQDALTGLGNRRAFDAALRQEVAKTGDPGRGRRDADRRESFSLLFVDLDHFKEVNDRFGHSIGDRVLRSVAAHCAAVVRPGDTLARIGGDEFAVVAPGAGQGGAERLAAALRAAVGRASEIPDADPLEATVSYAVFGRDGRDASELMRSVDRRLHQAKRARRQPPPDRPAFGYATDPAV